MRTVTKQSLEPSRLPRPVCQTQAELLCGFDFVIAPLVSPDYVRPALEVDSRDAVVPRARAELMLASAMWGGQVRAPKRARQAVERRHLWRAPRTHSTAGSSAAEPVT